MAGIFDTMKSEKEKKDKGTKAAPKTGGLFAQIRQQQQEDDSVARQDYTSKIDTTNLTIQPRHQTFASTMSNPPQHGATADQQKLGIVNAHNNAFQSQPQVNPEFKPSNPNVTAFTPQAHGIAGKTGALLQQLQHGAQTAIGFQQRPTSEVPSLGSKKVDEFVIGTGAFLPGLASGQTEAQLAGMGVNVVSKVLPKAGPLFSKILGHAAEGAIENARIGAAAGQTDARQVAENAGYGAGFGVGGALLGAAGGAVKRKVADVAEDLVRKSLGHDRAIRIFGTPEPETLALPLGRADAARARRGNVHDSSEPIVNPFTFALPEPRVGSPTSARVSRNINPYRQQFEDLIIEAQRLQDEGRFTPGHEDQDLRNLWASTAGKDAPSLDELIELAYKQPKEINTNLVNKARKYQAAREVAGAPIPVKSLSDRKSPQGTLANAAPIQQRYAAALREAEQPASRTEVTRSQAPDTGRSPQPQTGGIAAEPTPTAGGVFSEIRDTRKGANRPPRDAGVRGFFQTAEQSPNINEEVTVGLRQSPTRTYKPITNVGSIKKANRAITKDADALESKLLNKRRYDADDVTAGIRTIQELQRNGLTERAVTITEKLASELTKAGQTVQAASILNRLSPEGALLYVQRKVNRINDSLLKGQEPAKVTPEQADNITQAATVLQSSGASQERAGTVLELMTKARNGEALSAEEKQTVADFIKDAKQYIKKEAPETNKAPEPERLPAEFKNKRIKQKVLSFLDKQEQAARDRIKARRGQLSSTPFDEWADMAIIGASKLAKGAIKFSDYSASMIRDFGETVRPQLRKLYQRSGQILRDKAREISERRVTTAEQVAEKYLRSNEARLAPEDIDLVRNLAEKVSEVSGKEHIQASQDLHAILNSFERVGVGRKLSAAQYIAMLLNPLTQIRNVVGNELMYRLERLARIIATPIDIVSAKVTGGPRAVTFKSGPRVWDDFFTPTTDYWGNLVSGFKAGARGLNPAGLSNINEIGGLAFRSKYNPLTYLEKALGGTMKGFDHAAYMRSYNQQLREMAYLDAINKGVKGADAQREHIVNYMANLDGKAKEIADKYGQFSTLQNDSLLADKLSGFKRGLNQLSTLGASKDFGLGNAVLPFAKTPANLLLRSLDYSPAGIIRAAKQTYSVLRDPKTDLTRADVIASVSRALLGTSIGALGYYLADLGVLQGKSSDDAEVRKLMAQSGVKDFQINGTALRRVLGAMVDGGDAKEAAKMQPGDTLWGYQWAAPTSAPLAVGNTIYQGKEGKEGALKTVAKAVLNGAQTLLDSSVLRSLSQAFETQPGDDSSLATFGKNVLKNLPGTFLPSIVRQINTLRNNEVKETYSPDTLSNYINPTYQNVPGNNLPQRVDTLGRPIIKASTFFDVFLNPAARTKYNPTPEAKFAIDLLNETGDNTLAPRAVSKYITSKGVKKNLTTEQYVKLQTLVGQKTAELIDQINPNDTTENKAAAMLKALNAAGKYGRNELKKELGLQ